VSATERQKGKKVTEIKKMGENVTYFGDVADKFDALALTTKRTWTAETLGGLAGSGEVAMQLISVVNVQARVEETAGQASMIHQRCRNKGKDAKSHTFNNRQLPMCAGKVSHGRPR